MSVNGTWRCLRYCKSTIFQANHNLKCSLTLWLHVVCDTAKVRFFKQITTRTDKRRCCTMLFAILQKYDFSSKSQRVTSSPHIKHVVCDTAKVRFFKQITTVGLYNRQRYWLFAILQKYDFSSKSQRIFCKVKLNGSCLRYCKSTIFQANHNINLKRL